jgi:hypothetical protein
MNIDTKQIELVQDWNIMYPIGIEVVVTADDESEYKTKTRSGAWLLGDKTAVIQLEGRGGYYALERIREA